MTNKEKDDLFYLCSLIEYIGRITNNHRDYIVKQIGIKGLNRLYSLADVNHCLTFEQVSDEVIEEYKIEKGNYDTISTCKYKIPSYRDIGANYKRLIINISKEQDKDIIDVLYKVFTSIIPDAMSNFNSDFFYQNDSYFKACFLENEILN